MKPFEYARPETLDEAFHLLGEYGMGARLLAGGTDVMVKLRSGRTTPSIVIDIKRIGDLRADIVEFKTVEFKTHLRIGARVVMSQIVADARIQRYFPALAEAATVVGSIQIRNRATLAGNICNASPAADTAPVLLAHRAIVNLVGRSGTRSIPLNAFFLGPGRTAVSPAEIVDSIDFPIEPEPSGAAFGRITRRYGVDLATINLCCLVTRSGQRRFAFGAVAPTPILVSDNGGDLQSVVAHASPISDVRGSRAYRQAMLLTMSRRTLELAISRLP